MKIGIDIDDTLVDTKRQQIKYWKEYVRNNPNENFNEELPKSINEFGDEYINGFWDTYRELLNYHNYFKKDCGFYIDKLLEDGYELCIITSRMKLHYNDLVNRIRNWLHYNNIRIDEIHTDVFDKGEFLKDSDIDILVDDSCNHCNNVIRNGKIAILFNDDDDYNGLKVNSWCELYDIISKNYKI